ncbi:AbrB/MazE/SpoVT family DNA-binding domain-containing protein [Paenibacillus medicaginis]|uniref:AbrB/MazE/SpoVT family DNA-binding domain-containing protein n=1 Tax=Paenibacillus medicaginis TaxID=1470560 RepID=A0ABV5BUM0_9BACL
MSWSNAIVKSNDDLGRIAIPKEFRQALKIRPGEPLEVYLDHDNELIIIKKYNCNKLDYKTIWFEFKNNNPHLAVEMEYHEDLYKI